MPKYYFELGSQPSPLCGKGRHDRCAAYDNMVIHCTCGCHGKPGSPDTDWRHLLEPTRRGLTLRASRTEAEVAAAGSQLGRPLPPVLAAFYRQTDGFYDGSSQYDPAWSLSRLVEENSQRRGDGRCPSTLVGFGDDGTGDWFCLWADAHDGTIFHFGWIELEPRPISPDLRRFWPDWLDGSISV